MCGGGNNSLNSHLSSSDAEVSLGNFKGCEDSCARSYLSGSEQAQEANSLKSAKETTQSLDSKAAYNEKYAKGYGVRYPEGHIIRFYERILKYELGLTSGKVFDFGCGNGTHAEYFQSKGFRVYGVDIIKEAITQAQGIMGQRAKLIEPNQSVANLFDTQFDLVFANQSLYYLDNANLRRQVDELYSMTRKGGICFFTMMSRQNGYGKCITKELENGLSEVTLSGRLNEQSYIRFVNDESELKIIFAPFKTLYIGEYRSFDLYEPYNSEGSSHHYMFIGQKE